MDVKTVLEIIAEQLSVGVETISTETVFSDLGADSLDLFQIISALEEEFDFEFDTDQAERMESIGEVVEYIKNEVEKQA
ncbi:MAG: acyl carrier protein [Bacillota bacterium]